MTKPPVPARKRSAGAYPWQLPHVRNDLTVQLNTRLNEPLALKLEYLAAEDGLTKREVVEAALEDYLAREFKRRGISE